ncbi:hypothetical protein [Desulfoplanes formicivorans]|uniref:Lipoprotein n=1 Tax=Desulfoplanes formicivorans TaxID=1592317 RepID=A0A194AKN0_9BACT|nr:hypothetical protein [Desulfoplanes formicivorans]GAU09606.1 hypothetical protein DPF_2335 [Desulfoplanes formicivorans]
MKSRLCIFLVLLFLIPVFACAPTSPLPQPRRVVDPSQVHNAIKTPEWDIAAIKYEYSGQGLDYSKADLEPVFLVFKNIGQSTPKVLEEEMRGVGTDGDYLPYSTDEAVRLAFASETFKQTAKNALKSGGLGAALGGGLGAIITMFTGDNVLVGAGMGAAVGGAAFAAGSLPEAEAKLERNIKQELVQYAWKSTPIPPSYTRMGYVYLPANKGIDRMSITVRSGQRLETYVLPLLDSPEDMGKTGK